MALARRSRERGVDYWLGFVDALSTLILGIVFLLSVFVIVQFFLSQEVTGKVVGNDRLKDEGQIDQMAGKTQATYGDAKERAKDALDKKGS